MSEPVESPDNSIELATGVNVRPESLRYSFSRSSGPGGQSVNKLNTKAELRLDLRDIQGLSHPGLQRLRDLAGRRLTKNDELVITDEATRSQLENREACLKRLREMVAQAAITPRKRKKSRPSAGMIRRRLEEKRKQSEKKQRRSKPSQD